LEIDLDKCVGCGNCVAFCTMGAIYIQENRALINQDECVECNTCYRCCESENLNPVLVRVVRKMLSILNLRYNSRMDVCPTGALSPPKLEWPRSLRRAFSDPTAIHDATGKPGRGTEEMKTNEITGRIGPKDAGICIDMGRPGIGVTFHEVEQMTRVLASLGVAFETDNPVTALIENPATGVIRKDILREKVLSLIIEIKVSLEALPDVLKSIALTAADLETVVSVGVSSKCADDGSIPAEPVIRAAGFIPRPNGKTNLGLGRPLVNGRLS